MATNEEIVNRFGYHRPTPEAQEKMIGIRRMFTDMAVHINEQCPDSREKSLAHTALEEAQMRAIQSIAIHETPLALGQ